MGKPLEITARVVRPGQPEPVDRDWLDASLEERIEAVWTLTKICWAWVEEGEPRLHRSVARVQRPRR